DFGGKTSIFSHPVYLFLREFSLQDFRGGSLLDQSTGVIMTKRRKKYQEKEEIRHPDSPEGLVVAAANNRAFAERLVGVYRLAKAGVKHGRR
ncbi:hypothetical protein, partial [Escherichia coli]